MLWATISFFLFYALSLLWGGDFSMGIKSVEKKLLFLVLPALFLIFGKRENEVGKSVAIFIVSVNLALLICLCIAVYQASIYIGFQAWPFKYYNFTYWIGIHPGYLSLLVLLSLVCTGFMLKEKKGNTILWWAALIFQSFMLFFIGAKYAIFSFFISGTIFLCLFLFRFSRKQVLTGTLVFLSLVVCALALSVNSWKRVSGFNEALTARMELNEAGMALIAKNGIIGYGAGNVDTRLKKEYERLGLGEAFSENYNIHNQYLQTLLTTGIIGFALLVTIIVLTLKFADNRVFAFLLLLQFLLFFMIESALVRQKGVVPFVTWVLFLSLHLYKEQLPLSNNTDE